MGGFVKQVFDFVYDLCWEGDRGPPSRTLVRWVLEAYLPACVLVRGCIDYAVEV